MPLSSRLPEVLVTLSLLSEPKSSLLLVLLLYVLPYLPGPHGNET